MLGWAAAEAELTDIEFSPLPIVYHEVFLHPQATQMR
jgi:hypothetical protein